jgi:hypothetical protein
LAALKAGQQPMGAALARLRASRPPVSAVEATALRETCPGLDGVDREADFAQALVTDAIAYQAALMR